MKYAQDERSARFDLLNIAYGFLQKSVLSCESDDESVVLYESYRTMFELSGGVCLAVYLRDFF